MVEVEDGTLLHVGVAGEGPDVLVLTGGPGCVQYLERDEIAPRGFRAWYPEPRGVGRSQGGAHTMGQALADLEVVRVGVDVASWIVIGHSWGSDLAVRYAVEHPDSVVAVVGVAGRGPQRDATWSATYEAGKPSEPVIEIPWNPEVHASLGASFTEWIHQPDLWRRLADSRVPMRFLAAGEDIRPSAAARRARPARQPHDHPQCPPRLLGYRPERVDRDHHRSVRPRQEGLYKSKGPAEFSVEGSTSEDADSTLKHWSQSLVRRLSGVSCQRCTNRDAPYW